HPAMAAEQMLGRSRPEPVAHQRIAARHEFEIRMLDDDVEEAGHPAHRAVAVERRHRRFQHFRLEAHRPAVTAASELHFPATLEISSERRTTPRRTSQGGDLATP